MKRGVGSEARTYRSSIQMVFDNTDHCTAVGDRHVDCMVSGTRDSDSRRDPCVMWEWEWYEKG